MSTDNKTYTHPQLLGQQLLKLGFKHWFLYTFKIVEGTPFIVEEMHADLFQFFQDLHDLNVKRGIVNIPPRSAKTVMQIYFIAYCWAINQECDFIYTSYSNDLTKEGAALLAKILKNPKYKAMFPIRKSEEDTTYDALDEYWRQFADTHDETGKPVFSAKFVKNESGGRALFTQMGASITGFGAGRRSATGFSGGVFMDDPNKPGNIYSKKVTRSTNDFYAETILSRLNNSLAFLCCIQQRLHAKNDMTAFLLNNYKNFTVLRKPLVDDNGICLLPSQYTEERIEELQINEYAYKAQYQQKPISKEAQVIKGEWFNYYDANSIPEEFDFTIIVGDTTLKGESTNDYTVFQKWGKVGNNFYLLDQFRDHVHVRDLESKANLFYYGTNSHEDEKFRMFYVEEMVSGVGLLADLQDAGIPADGVSPMGHNKFVRVQNVLGLLKFVYLPMDKEFTYNFVQECEEFMPDDSHDNDDQVDVMVYAIEKMRMSKPKQEGGYLGSC